MTKKVLVTGTFDLLHIGHVRYLFEAKKLGDKLIVAIGSDEYVRSKKGVNRPIVPAKQRAEVLSALKPVDQVVIIKNLDELISYARASQIDICAIASGESKKIQEADGWRAKLIAALPAIEIVTVHSKVPRSTSTTRLLARVISRVKK